MTAREQHRQVWRDDGNGLHISREFFDELSSYSTKLKAILRRGKDEGVLFLVGTSSGIGKKRRTAKPDPGILCEMGGCHQLTRGKNKFCEHHSVIVRAKLASSPNESRASVREVLYWSGSS